jgi:hypothetical protein
LNWKLPDSFWADARPGHKAKTATSAMTKKSDIFLKLAMIDPLTKTPNPKKHSKPTSRNFKLYG